MKNIDAFLLRHEFSGMTDDRLREWQFILADEVANGPRETVRLTRQELELLERIMEERRVTNLTNR